MVADRLQSWMDEVHRDPASLTVLSLVDALRRQGRLEEARRYALRGLEQHPHLADAHDALARVMADLGDDAQAGDEWSFALRLDPMHLDALRGLGFLAWKRRDLAGAEQYLARALQASPTDDGLAAALRRVRSDLRRPGAPPAAEAPLRPATPSTAAASRALFAPLLGDGDRTALLLDRDGLVLAGTYVDGTGTDVADEIGAHLGGLADEARRALEHLSLGRWDVMLAEAQHATVVLGPAPDGAVVMVAAARDTQVGLVRRLLVQARQRAMAWMAGT